MVNIDEFYMGACLEEAWRYQGLTYPNPAVGAAVLKNGALLSIAAHQKAGGPHAEINALRQAGSSAQGATVYVTLEPCCHYGRTPPCSKTLVEAGVKRVVVAMTDPNPRVAGQGLAELRAAGIEVESGVLREQAEQLNPGFIQLGIDVQHIRAEVYNSGCVCAIGRNASHEPLFSHTGNVR